MTGDLLEESAVPASARALKREARSFAEDRIEPVAADRFAAAEYPWDLLEAGQEAGLVAAELPAEYGGRDLSLAELLAIAEEFYRADAGIALTLQLASFGAPILVEHGTDEQIEAYVAPVARGEAITGLAISEPDTGSDLAGMETAAERDGEEYVLDGEKYWIGNGVEADWVTVYAKTGDGPDRYGNYSLFVVPTDTEGYEAEHVPEKIGFRAAKQAHVRLDGCRVPAENRVGVEGAGFYMVAEYFNRGRVVVGGHGVGLAAAAIEESSAFVHERESYGRSLDELQAVQHELAEMRMGFEASRALVWRAADRVAVGAVPGYWAALAKAEATETAVDCAERGMRLHGGRSVLADSRISRVYRDAQVPVVYEGANAVQRDLIYRQAPR